MMDGVTLDEDLEDEMTSAITDTVSEDKSIDKDGVKSTTPENDCDDDEENYGPILHETHAIQINNYQRVNLSNRPFLLDVNGELIPYTRPGLSLYTLNL